MFFITSTRYIHRPQTFTLYIFVAYTGRDLMYDIYKKTTKFKNSPKTLKQLSTDYTTDFTALHHACYNIFLIWLVRTGGKNL